MSTPMIDKLRAQCDGPRDGALLRFSLANAWLAEGEHAAAIAECRRALDFDAGYSAAWKLLGKALQADADEAGAAEAWRQGIRVAAERGDKQAEKEMRVFLRRARK